MQLQVGTARLAAVTRHGVAWRHTRGLRMI